MANVFLVGISRRFWQRFLAVGTSCAVFLTLLTGFGQVKAAENCEAIKCESTQSDFIACNQSQQQCWQRNIAEAQNSAGTLKSAISVLNGQISLKQLQINETQAEIKKLETEIAALSDAISNLSLSLDNLTKLLMARATAQYRQSRTSVGPLQVIMTQTFGQALSKLQYLAETQQQTVKAMQLTETQRLEFDNQKKLKEKKQAELVAARAKLARDQAALKDQQNAKNKLLADTQNDEARYQQLLSAARNQLASFSRFVSSQGSSGILGNQTKCDGWGCYYNQRDQAWGNSYMGLSKEIMSKYGCLVTSVAMVASHYGKSLTPGDIANSPNPFFGSTAYMRQGTWSVNGATITRTRIGSSRSKIDEELSAGRPVIVGIYGGPDHFLVIKEKKDDDYIMYDPYPENGKGILFTSKYPLSAITTVDRVTVN